MDVLDEKEFDFALVWRVNGKLGPRTRAAVAAILYLGPIRTYTSPNLLTMTSILRFSMTVCSDLVETWAKTCLFIETERLSLLREGYWNPDDWPCNYVPTQEGRQLTPGIQTRRQASQAARSDRLPLNFAAAPR